MRTLAFLTACAAVGACASSPAKAKAYIAPTRETISATLEGADGREDAGHVVVENRSTVPITVTSVTLHECENILETCDHPYRMNKKIGADSREIVMRVSKGRSSEGYTFSYSYTWVADSNSSVALTTLAEFGSKEAADRLASMKHADEIRRREVGFVDEELDTVEIARLGEKIATLRAEPDSILLDQGAVLFIQQLRMLAIGAQGEVLGRYRGRFRFRAQPGAIRFAPPDSLIAVASGRSVVTVMPQPPAGPARSTPFPTLRFTLIVR